MSRIEHAPECAFASTDKGMIDGAGNCYFPACTCDALERANKEIERLVALLRPFANYAEKRLAKPFLGLGDEIHVIHCGTEWEACLLYSDCIDAHKALSHTKEGK